ncbi:hypothetical protein CC78DRAFT_151290 [Lojkania enalia]|uniref:Uncharacterized protein n=1 Tax=Lojkania enalia TaxID=147567 RepID=A0A9P4JX35_9PLEO|nr:hypothetical protein CC78DRAFT_151290 [Didymosphaeria enalia]
MWYSATSQLFAFLFPLMCSGHPEPKPFPHPHPEAFPYPEPEPYPRPKPYPYPEPKPHAYPQPEAYPLPKPHSQPKPYPDQYNNYAPFSGAIYIVNSNGQPVEYTGSNMCPSWASISCNNIHAPSWCCPALYTCSSPEDWGGVIGCCPAGSSCAGFGSVASVTTITVQAALQTTEVYIPPECNTAPGNPAPNSDCYNNPYPTENQVYQNGFCSTLTMSGPGLPTTAQGDCGVILIVNHGSTNFVTIGYGFGMFLILLHFAIGRMFAMAR